MKLIEGYKIGDRRYCNNCNDLLPSDHTGIDICLNCLKLGEDGINNDKKKYIANEGPRTFFKKVSND